MRSSSNQINQFSIMKFDETPNYKLHGLFLTSSVASASRRVASRRVTTQRSKPSAGCPDVTCDWCHRQIDRQN